MRTPLAFLAPLALAAFACSSNSPTAPTDAGADASPLDSGAEAGGGGFNPPGYDAGSGSSSGGGVDSGESQCDQLRDQVNAKAATASACDPLLTQQCGATTPGICCPLTISNGVDPSAVNDFNAAVNAFKNAGCPTDCTKFPCSTAPSNICSGSGHTGTCN